MVDAPFQPFWQQVEYWPQQTMDDFAAIGRNSNDMAAMARLFPTPTGGYTETPPLQGPSIGYNYITAPGASPSGFSTDPPPGGFVPTQINAWGNQPGGLGGGVPGAIMPGTSGTSGAWGNNPGGALGAAGTPGPFTPNPQGVYSGDVEGGGSPTATQTPTPELGIPDSLSTPAPSSELGTPTTIDMPATTSDNLAGGGGYPGLSDSLAGSQFGGSLSDAGLMRNLIAAMLTNRGGGGGGGSPWGGSGGVGGLFGGSSGLGGKLGL